MIGAKVIIRGDDRTLGWWDFIVLPRQGEVISVKLNDKPATFEVAGIIHVPVVADEKNTKAPYAIVVVHPPESVVA